MSEMRVRPFHCGTQFGDWTGRNCDGCAKSLNFLCGADAGWHDLPERRRCEIEYAISYAYCDDGTIPTKLAQRMGFDPGAYSWPCPEREAVS